MTEKELDNAAEAFAKSYVASIASGTAEEMNILAGYVKAGYKAGYKADLAGYDRQVYHFPADKRVPQELLLFNPINCVHCSALDILLRRRAIPPLRSKELQFRLS